MPKAEKETIFIVIVDHNGKTIQKMRAPFIITGKGIKQREEYHKSMILYNVTFTSSAETAASMDRMTIV